MRKIFISFAVFFMTGVQSWAFYPSEFQISPTGEVTCGEMDDSCNWAEKLFSSEAGDVYILEGSYSTQDHIPQEDRYHDSGMRTRSYIYLCTRVGSKLIPTYSFLDGGELTAVADLSDYNSDGIKDVFVTTAHKGRKSKVKVWTFVGGRPFLEHEIESHNENARVDFDQNGTPLITVYRARGDEASKYNMKFDEVLYGVKGSQITRIN